MIGFTVLLVVTTSLFNIGFAIPADASTAATTTAQTIGGCTYVGKVYQVGESWDHGCRYQCTCLDTTGKYTCKDLCPSYLNVPDVCKMVAPAGECCPQPDCSGTNITMTTFKNVSHSGNGPQYCTYHGTQYAQDETWRDGCEWQCTCSDASNGYYKCSSLCYSWSLPPVCHMEPAPEGKCCETPSCPVGYNIVYPNGYVAN